MNTIATQTKMQTLPWAVRPLLRMLTHISDGSLELTTPEGFRLVFGDGNGPQADLQLGSWKVLRRLVRHGDIGLAECHRDGLLRSSDLTALLRLGIRNQHALEKMIHGNRWLKLGYRLRHLLRRNTRKGSARNIEAHYDLGNDFYRLWLDPSMTYSSACFNDGLDGDLMAAQHAKYQRMLDLTGARPGQRVLEIGCGWGGFAEYAAQRGITVHGVTLSQQQLEYAKQRLGQAGLGHLAGFHIQDYRELNEQFDHIVSIEMLEAVGEPYWTTYFSQIRRLLKPGGKAAIQTIVIDDALFEDYRKGTDFIQQHIFPGGMLPAPKKLAQLAADNDLNLAGRHYFGQDYAETLRRWKHSFRENLVEVRKQGFDQQFIRLWSFYLAYCEAGFDEKRIDVMHLQLVRD